MQDTISPQSEVSETLAEHKRRALRTSLFASPLLAITVVTFALLVLGSMLASRAMDENAQQIEASWQRELTMVAEGKASQLSSWINGQQQSLQILANNSGLIQYLQDQRELADAPALAGKTIRNASPSEPPFITIRKLLESYSQQMGLRHKAEMTEATSAGSDIATGIMLLDANSKQIISTMDHMMDPAKLDNFLTQDASAPAISDLVETPRALYLGYTIPIFKPKAEADDIPEKLGYILAIKRVDAELRDIFQFPGGLDEQVMLEMVKPTPENVTILPFAAKPEEDMHLRRGANDALVKVEARALAEPGKWLEVLPPAEDALYMIGTPAKQTPWYVIASVPKNYALAASVKYKQMMMGILLGFAIIMVLLIMAVALLASSKRALSHSRHFRALAKQSHLQEMLLKTVTNAQPESLFLIDSDFKFRYANYQAAKMAGNTVEHMMGKSLQDVLGASKAQTLIKLATDAMNTERAQTLMLSQQKDGKERSILRTLVPVFSLAPGSDGPDTEPHVLITDRDITEVTEARERRLKLNNELVELLVALMDQRDQFATNHSRHVAELASNIAKSMGLNAFTRTHVYYAGLLLNIGKMVVPERWLNSHELLDNKSVETIRQSLRASSKILSKLDFDKEVIHAMSQAHEYLDGTGAQGLKDEDICMEGKIITVANSCISMLSPRAYREAMTWSQVAEYFNQQSGIKFDKRVVAGLMNYMENMGGKKELKLSAKAAA